MKLLGVLLLCAFVAAVPTAVQKIDLGIELPSEEALATPEGRNILIDAMMHELFAYIRFIINYGSAVFRIPPSDPLVLDSYHLHVPAGLVNLNLDLKNAVMTGLGGFVVHSSNFVPSQLSFDFDISVPSIEIIAEHYDLVGDFFTAIPLYGKGQTRFQIDQFRFRGKLLIKQSEDGKSVLIDRVISAGYDIPSFKSELTGVIGGGEIDKIVNLMLEEVFVDYLNRFQGAVAALVSDALPAVANPILEQLDTWKYVNVFV